MHFYWPVEEKLIGKCCHPSYKGNERSDILVSTVPSSVQHVHVLLAIGLSHAGQKEREKLCCLTQARNVHDFIWSNGMS